MATAEKSMQISTPLWRTVLVSQEFVLAVITVIGILILATQSDKFLTAENLLNQGRLATEVALVALPMTFIIITGGIDLSVGSTMGLCAIASAGTLSVTLLQGNVAQDEKFSQERMPEAMAWVASALSASRAELVVAPETAVPI